MLPPQRIFPCLPASPETIIEMDHEQAGPSRPRQQAIESQERELELDLDLQALSFLFSSGHYDDEKLSAPAIVNQEVNGLFEDLAQMHGLLITMKASPAADIMGGLRARTRRSIIRYYE